MKASIFRMDPEQIRNQEIGVTWRHLWQGVLQSQRIWSDCTVWCWRKSQLSKRWDFHA